MWDFGNQIKLTDTMNKAVKILVEVLLLAAIAGLAYLLYSNIMQPVNFNKEKASRQAVAVQRLKDIRTLQVAHKSVTGKFNSSIDSLKQFYETGTMDIVMQIGSMDDSIAVANTEAIKKANRKLKPEQGQISGRREPCLLPEFGFEVGE